MASTVSADKSGTSIFGAFGWKVFCALRRVTPSTYYRRLVEPRLGLVRAVETYVLLTLVVMLIAAALAGRDQTLDVVLVVLVIVRLFEIGQVVLGTVLEADGERATAEMGGGREHFPRSSFLIIALIYLLQVGLAFAVLDHALTPRGFRDPAAPRLPHHTGDFLYLSATTMFPLASYVAATALARILTACEIACSFVGITLLLGIAVGQFHTLPPVQSRPGGRGTTET